MAGEGAKIVAGPFKVTIDDSEVLRALEKLLAVGDRKGIEKALMKGGKIVAKEARKNVHPQRKTGRLEKSIKARVKRDKVKPDEMIITVRPIDTPYWHFVEFGHKKKGGGEVAGSHYLERAYNAKRDTVIDIVKKDLQAAVKKATR